MGESGTMSASRSVLVIFCAFALVHTALANTSPASAFDSADMDKDGFLTKRELADAVELAGGKAPTTKAERGSLMMQMDSNRDKKVDKTEFTTAMERGNSLFGKIGLVATRTLDNVGLMYLLNELAVMLGITPGNQVFDFVIFTLLSALYCAACVHGFKVSYFVKMYKYALGFAMFSFAWLICFSALDMNTEYCAGFTVLSFVLGVVGAVDYVMDEASGNKKKDGRKNVAQKAKRAMGRR